MFGFLKFVLSQLILLLLLGEKNRSSEIGFSREEMKSGTKIAVITGSAGGLGKEFAEKLLESG